jgi:hypothetical protein
MHVVINYLKATYKRNMQVTTTHFNANIMSTMLFGCGIWGWEKMLPNTADWIHNTWQSKLSHTISDVLHIPNTTATVIIMCESGIWPLVYYAIKQAVKLADSFPMVKSDIFNHAIHIQTNDGFMHNLHALLTQLDLPCDNIPPLDQIMDVVHQKYINMFNDMRIDPLLPDHPHRKTSAYLSWIWNGKLHCRPAFHKASLSPVDFHTGLHARMLNATIPVNVHTSKPYIQRICPLCKQGACDMKHVFVDCNKLAHIRHEYAVRLGGAAIAFPKLFQSADDQIWTYITSMLSPFRDVCQRLSLIHI